MGEGAPLSARNARTGSTRNRTGSMPDRGREAGGRAATARRSGRARGGMGAGDPTGASADSAPQVDRAVVGPVPVIARVAGILLVLAGLAGAVAPFLPYL